MFCNRTIFLAWAGLVVVPAEVRSQNGIDEKTKTVVRNVGTLYKTAAAMHADVAIHVTVELDGRDKREVKANGTVDFRRPLSFALRTIVLHDPNMGLDAVCDGKSFILHSRRQKQFTERQPTTMAEIGRILLTLGLPTTGMLFQNVLADDPADALFEGVIQGQHAGSEKIGDTNCYHLTFKQLNMDWELWVAADGPPLVLKTKSVTKVPDGKVTTIETYTNWKLNPTFDKDPFQFQPPADAAKVDRLTGQRGG